MAEGGKKVRKHLRTWRNVTGDGAWYKGFTQQPSGLDATAHIHAMSSEIAVSLANSDQLPSIDYSQ